MKVYILRGVSGSGKSTEAKRLVKDAVKAGVNMTLVCSADDYFMKNGKYEFDAKLLNKAHAWCKGKFVAALDLGVEVIVVDNTSTQKWEYEEYVELAKEYLYDIEIVKVGSLDEASLKVYANRNRHGVPLDVIRKQAKRFED